MAGLGNWAHRSAAVPRSDAAFTQCSLRLAAIIGLHRPYITWAEGVHRNRAHRSGLPKRESFSIKCALTKLRHAESMRLALFLLCALAACNAAGPHFRSLPATQVTIDGTVFDVRVRENLAEAIRLNSQYAPRFGPLQTYAGLAMAEVSGCDVLEVRGDAAQATGILDCGDGGPRIDRLRPLGEYDCLVIEDYISPATNELVLALDCTLI